MMMALTTIWMTCFKSPIMLPACLILFFFSFFGNVAYSSVKYLWFNSNVVCVL